MPLKKDKPNYSGISVRARAMLDTEESYDVEYKESANALENRDIVAFANSDSGGCILIGVREATRPDGSQYGKIIGCPIGDKEKLKIINKAESCVPPIDLEIIVENMKRKPFYRVEIPSGVRKPYCTPGGTYTIRGDGLVRPIYPGRLLAMLVELENTKFVGRFREATGGLENHLHETRKKLESELDNILKTVGGMKKNIETSLDQIARNGTHPGKRPDKKGRK